MNNRFLTWTWRLLIPVAFALIVRYLFGIRTWSNLYSVMTSSFLFGLPVAIGVLTTYLSPVESVRSILYRICAPWGPVVLFFFATIFFGWEGWACWIMVLPVFMLGGALGGIIGGYLRVRKEDKRRNNNISISLLVLLPLLTAPLESMIEKIPGQYKAYTVIDIEAPKDVIWRQVTRVKEIPERQDKGWLTRFLGFPRPVRAELNFEGVGAHREAIFTNGLVFHEEVLQYEHQRKMTFSIKANPYEIPSTTMDEHVVIGGNYFDVLDGVYELEQLSATGCRLHLYSHFKLSTTFNFYAGWWAGWIMKDIQNNILQVIKLRAEGKQH